MPDAAVLDLACYYPPAARAKRLRLRWVLAGILAPVVLVLAGAAAWRSPGLATVLQALGWQEPARPVIRLRLDDLRRVSNMTVDDKSQILVEGVTAQQRNALIPLSALPIEHARRFLMPGLGESTYATALKCLTQAVYYEAALEPLAGRRAVAQVVLNRVRHPAYPKSICGVVYQGAERRTGCQFSFTCDGSLLRAPMAQPWHDAQVVARAALGGYQEPLVGTATHYHADYVLPKWAFELGKISKLGRHIFYRFNGSWGRAPMFSGAYSGIEHIPALNLLALRDRAAAEDAAGLPEDVAPGLTVPRHVTDRHAETDVGGRLDVTKPWRLSIPDPVGARSRYSEAIEASSPPGKVTGPAAVAERQPAEAGPS